MGKQNRITLKNYFQTGKVPTQGEYADLIDSFMNLEDEDTQLVKGTLSASKLEIANDITASGNISASGYISASAFAGFLSASYISQPFKSTVIIEGATNHLSCSGDLVVRGSSSFTGDITASNSHISCSKLSAEIGHFKKIKGFSPIEIEDPVNFTSGSVSFTHGVTASGDLQVGGTIFGTIGSGTGAQTGITSIGTQTKFNVNGPTQITGSVIELVPTSHVRITGSLGVSATVDATDYLIAGKNAIDYQVANSRIVLGHYSQAILTWGANVILGADNSQNTHIFGDAIITGSLTLGGTTITSTAAEINRLDGVLSNVKEAYDAVSYNATDGRLTFTELDNGTDTVNLGIGTNSSPTFAGLTLSKNVKGAIGAYGETINAGDGNSFIFTVAEIPPINRKDSGKANKSTPTFIRSDSTATTSTIIVTCLTHQLSVTAFGNATDTASATPGFFISIANESATENFEAGTATFSCVIL